jgi:hypothetical protein
MCQLPSQHVIVFGMINYARADYLFHADQVLNDLIQDESEKPNKKLSYLKIELVEEMGWC